MKTIRLTVNGTDHTVTVAPRVSLADVLREKLQLTGTHLGCEQGVCGACTVLVDGRPARACLVLGVQAEGAEITTIEGLADDEVARPIFDSFLECRAFQCGFCTPGIIVSLRSALAAPSPPTDDEIIDVLTGHICRCTGYTAILDAARRAWRGDS